MALFYLLLDEAGVFPRSSGMGRAVFQVSGTDNQMDVDLLEQRLGRVVCGGTKSRPTEHRCWDGRTGVCSCRGVN